MINSVKTFGIIAPDLIKASSTAHTGTEETASAKTTDTLPATPKLSSVAHQLSESAERARIRDSTLSRQQLGELGRELEYKVVNDGALEERARRALEVPDTEDPERLERAVQATRFVATTYQADPRVTNPFVGLPRNQLSLIVYDDSGAYTLNERGSAWKGIKQIDMPWNHKVMAEGQLEKTQTGGKPNFYRECVAHYRALPTIEQAMHPADYEARTLRFMEEDLEAQRAGKKDETMLTLVELLARMNTQLPNYVAGGANPALADKAPEAEEIKTNN